MPIKSYLAYPTDGHFDQVANNVSQIPNCEVVTPENNTNLLVILSDTANSQEEEQFQESIANVPELAQLVLVSAFDA